MGSLWTFAFQRCLLRELGRVLTPWLLHLESLPFPTGVIFSPWLEIKWLNTLPSDLLRILQNGRRFTCLHEEKKENKMGARELTCTEYLKYAGPWFTQYFHLLLRASWEVGATNQISQLRKPKLTREINIPSSLSYVADLGIVIMIIIVIIW